MLRNSLNVSMKLNYIKKGFPNNTNSFDVFSLLFAVFGLFFQLFLVYTCRVFEIFPRLVCDSRLCPRGPQGNARAPPRPSKLLRADPGLLAADLVVIVDENE